MIGFDRSRSLPLVGDGPDLVPQLVQPVTVFEVLGELLFLVEDEDLAFDGFLLTVDDTSLVARLEGGSILSRSKEIKAVTYHRLEISETKRGLETSIIFDV